MEEVKEACRYCAYTFKETEDMIHTCPVCCASRDRYANIAKQTGVSREEAKHNFFVHLFGGIKHIQHTIHKQPKQKILIMDYADAEALSFANRSSNEQQRTI